MGINPHTLFRGGTRFRVHRIPNLRVASASVSPASGGANPTLTIMQLVRLKVSWQGITDP
jgi:GMC oxidoreductase